MITQEFLDMTDNLIKHVKQYDLHMLNGEILIAKQPPPKATKGGLVLSEDYSRREGYFRGYGRVIKVPASTFKTTEGELPAEPLIKEGDFVLFNHASRYKPYADLVNFMLDQEVETKEIADQYAGEYSDAGIIFIVPQADVKMVRDGTSVKRQVTGE